MKAWSTILLIILVLIVVGVIIAAVLAPQTTKGFADSNGKVEYNETEAMATVDDVFITDDTTDTVEIGELVE
jgi:hypothetical protein